MLLKFLLLIFCAIAGSQNAARIELNPSVFEFKLKEFVDFALKHTEVQVYFI